MARISLVFGIIAFVALVRAQDGYYNNDDGDYADYQDYNNDYGQDEDGLYYDYDQQKKYVRWMAHYFRKDAKNTRMGRMEG